jgi:hypothetical protein
MMVMADWPVTIQCNEELAAVSEPSGFFGGKAPTDWTLTDALLIRVKIVQGATVEVSVPRYYTWDGASIPALCWSLIGKPLDPRFAMASLVHDWICEHAETRPQRVFADAMFLWLLRDAGVPAWRHYAMFLAVTAYRRAIWRAKK